MLNVIYEKNKAIKFIQLGCNFRGKNKHTLNVGYADYSAKCLPISCKVYEVLKKKGFVIEG